jgi:hypothetical protein
MSRSLCASSASSNETMRRRVCRALSARILDWMARTSASTRSTRSTHAGGSCALVTAQEVAAPASCAQACARGCARGYAIVCVVCEGELPGQLDHCQIVLEFFLPCASEHSNKVSMHKSSQVLFCVLEAAAAATPQ